MKANPGKSNILLSDNASPEKVRNNDVVLTSSVEEKLLGITPDSRLKFENSLQAFVTNPVKKTMFCLELQVICH